MTTAAYEPVYAIHGMPPTIYTVVCRDCKQPYTAGHVCPALFRDLSPLGGGPNPWKDKPR